jgi:hypothetical protein
VNNIAEKDVIMEVKWLVEDFEGDGSLDPIISEIKSQGMQCEVVNYTPFQGGEYNQYSGEDCVIFYGSLNLARQLQKEKPWVPGPICNFKNLCCKTYYSYWGEYLFNQDYIMLPMLEIKRKREEIFKQFGVDDTIFIRPDSGAKTFAGQTVPLEFLDKEFELFSYYAAKPMDEILAVISSPKPIDNEWRVVISTEYGLVAASQYKKGGRLFEMEGCPLGVMEIAENISKEPWQPDSMYTVDVCESDGEYHFLEVNSFSCSGLYKCKPKYIVETASKVALEEWKDYQEP